jgi:hypothetical protein
MSFVNGWKFEGIKISLSYLHLFFYDKFLEMLCAHKFKHIELWWGVLLGWIDTLIGYWATKQMIFYFHSNI